MKSVLRITVVVSLLMMAGCGSPGDSLGDGSNTTYGTLALSGNGSTVSGTQFTAAVHSGSSTYYAWLSNDNKAVNVSDYGSYKIVGFFDDITAGKSYQWISEVQTGVTIGSSSITFHNVSLEPYENTPNYLTLTLNGTLNF